MVKVTLDGHTLAESSETIVIENNHYFPPKSVNLKLFFTDSETSSVCPWKGIASYYNAVVDGKTTEDVAWYYPKTITDRAKVIEGYVAFYKNKVQIQT